MFVHTSSFVGGLRLINSLNLILGQDCAITSEGVELFDVDSILKRQPNIPTAKQCRYIDLEDDPQKYVIAGSTLCYGKELLGAETLKYPDGKRRDIAVLIHATPPESAFERWWREWRVNAQVIVG